MKIIQNVNCRRNAMEIIKTPFIIYFFSPLCVRRTGWRVTVGLIHHVYSAIYKSNDNNKRKIQKYNRKCRSVCDTKCREKLSGWASITQHR